jgi:hypothetical protein
MKKNLKSKYKHFLRFTGYFPTFDLDMAYPESNPALFENLADYIPNAPIMFPIKDRKRKTIVKMLEESLIDDEEPTAIGTIHHIDKNYFVYTMKDKDGYKTHFYEEFEII